MTLNYGREQQVGKEKFGIDRCFAVVINYAILKTVYPLVLYAQREGRNVLSAKVSFGSGLFLSGDNFYLRYKCTSLFLD